MSPVPADAAAPEPQLSVVIPFLNAEATLGAQLEALASQPCPVEWEVLLCDNGSTDGSRIVAERYRRRLPNLRIVDASAHRGPSAARNLGVRLARGERIAFCDADDVVARDWLARMTQALTEHRFVAGRFDGSLLNSRLVQRSRQLDQQDGLQTSGFGPRLPHAGAGNMGLYRSDFLAVGGFDTTLSCLEDTDLSWRLQLKGIPLAFCKDVLVHVRLRSSMWSMYRQGRQYGNAYALLERRYPSPATGEVVAAAPAPVRRVTDWLFDRVVSGRFVWKAGWIAGHRGWGAPIPQPAPPPSPLTEPLSVEIEPGPADDVRR